MTQRAVAVPPLEGTAGSAVASTATTRVLGSLLHLLAERPRPAVICLAIQDIPSVLVPCHPLSELINVHVSLIFHQLLGAIDLIHLLQKTFQSLDQ